jgi:hypothetical protein
MLFSSSGVSRPPANHHINRRAQQYREAIASAGQKEGRALRIYRKIFSMSRNTWESNYTVEERRYSKCRGAICRGRSSADAMA